MPYLSTTAKLTCFILVISITVVFLIHFTFNRLRPEKNGWNSLMTFSNLNAFPLREICVYFGWIFSIAPIDNWIFSIAPIDNWIFSIAPMDNKSWRVHVMALRWTGEKPLPVPMMTQFTDAYMYHQASMCWIVSRIVLEVMAFFYNGLTFSVLWDLMINWLISAKK